MSTVPRITGVVTIAIDRTNANGSIGHHSWLRIWRALNGAPAGALVRIDIGDTRYCDTPPAMDDAMCRAGGIEITGTNPDGVRAVIDALRRAA